MACRKKLLMATWSDCRCGQEDSFIHSFIHQWLYSPLLGPDRVFSFVIIYTVSWTPWTGDQSVASPLPTHTTAQTQIKCTLVSMSRVGFELTIPVFERADTVHASERVLTVIGVQKDRLQKCLLNFRIDIFSACGWYLFHNMYEYINALVTLLIASFHNTHDVCRPLLSVNSISRRCECNSWLCLEGSRWTPLLAPIWDTVIRNSINNFSIQSCMRVPHTLINDWALQLMSGRHERKTCFFCSYSFVTRNATF
jgi:hypothetical protein